MESTTETQRRSTLRRSQVHAGASALLVKCNPDIERGATGSGAGIHIGNQYFVYRSRPEKRGRVCRERDVPKFRDGALGKDRRRNCRAVQKDTACILDVRPSIKVSTRITF